MNERGEYLSLEYHQGGKYQHFDIKLYIKKFFVFGRRLD